MNCTDQHILQIYYIPNNVPVLHFFQERNLMNGGAGNPLILLLEVNLLQRDGLLGDAVATLSSQPFRTAKIHKTHTYTE